MTYYICNSFKFRERSIQYLAVFGINVGIFTTGMHFGWPSTSLPLLTSGNFSIYITAAEGSLLTTIPSISVIFGSVITAMTMRLVGGKTIMLINAIPLTASWLSIALTNSKIYLYIARFLAGFVDGSLMIVGPSYLSEIADYEVRGLFGTSIMFSYAFGVAAINVLAVFMSPVSIAFLASTITLLMFIIIPLLPESPYFYLLNGNTSGAEVSLQKIKKKRDISKDLDRISRSITEHGDDKGKVTDLLTEKHFRKCLLIALVLSFTQYASGNNAIQAYSETVFQKNENIISSRIANGIFYAVFFIATMLSPLIVDNFGRKPLLLVSTGSTTLALFAIGTFMYFQNNSHFGPKSESIQLVLFLLFTVSFSSGLYTIPTLVTSEIFPANLVGTALCMNNIVFSVMSSSAIFLFEWSYYSIGVYVPFYVFSVCCLCGMILIAFFLIETKGKTLEEIQLAIR